MPYPVKTNSGIRKIGKLYFKYKKISENRIGIVFYSDEEITSLLLKGSVEVTKTKSPLSPIIYDLFYRPGFMVVGYLVIFSLSAILGFIVA